MSLNGKYVFAGKIYAPVPGVPTPPSAKPNISMWRNINWSDMTRVTSNNRLRISIDSSMATIRDKKYVILAPRQSDLLIPGKKIVAYYGNSDWAGEYFIIYEGNIAQHIVHGSGLYVISNDIGTLTKI